MAIRSGKDRSRSLIKKRAASVRFEGILNRYDFHGFYGAGASRPYWRTAQDLAGHMWFVGDFSLSFVADALYVALNEGMWIAYEFPKKDGVTVGMKVHRIKPFRFPRKQLMEAAKEIAAKWSEL